MRANDVLARLQELGLSDGVKTTVADGKVTVEAGAYTASAKIVSDPEDAHLEAFQSLLNAIADAGDAPKWHESTTRTVALPESDETGERVVVAAEEA